MRVTRIEVSDFDSIHFCVDSGHTKVLKVAINGNPEEGGMSDIRNLIYAPQMEHSITFLLMNGGKVLAQRTILLLPVENMRHGYQAIPMDRWQQLKRFSNSRCLFTKEQVTSPFALYP